MSRGASALEEEEATGLDGACRKGDVGVVVGRVEGLAIPASIQMGRGRLVTNGIDGEEEPKY